MFAQARRVVRRSVWAVIISYNSKFVRIQVQVYDSRLSPHMLLSLDAET